MPKIKQNRIKRDHSKSRKILFFLVILFLILLGVLFLILNEYNLIDYSLFLSKTEKKLNIEDRCDYIVGQLIHTINNEEQCRMSCLLECKIRDYSFENFNFTKKDKACNECTCFCER